MSGGTSSSGGGTSSGSSSGTSSGGWDDGGGSDGGSTGSGVMVWIPNSGSKYHSYSGCSGMVNPTQVTKEQAIAWGYEACKNCW